MGELDQKTKAICENIKKLRELRGITRESMAADLELSVSSYGKLERGEVELTIKRLYQIAGLLETDISKLMDTDFAQVFNVSHNNYVQGLGATSEHITFNTNGYLEKYVKMLEEKIANMQKQNSRKY
jgi:transcriptional regulator with XRE-family HTH domain